MNLTMGKTEIRQNSSIVGHAAAFIAYAIFGFNIIVCKDLTSGNLIPPLGIFTLRSIVAGGLFWIVSMFLPKEKIDKKDYIRIFAASMIGFLACQLTFLVGIPHITPMDCSYSHVADLYDGHCRSCHKRADNDTEGRWSSNQFCRHHLPDSQQGDSSRRSSGKYSVRNIHDHIEQPQLLHVSRHFQATDSKVFGRDIHEMDIPVLSMRFRSPFNERSYRSRMVLHSIGPVR